MFLIRKKRNPPLNNNKKFPSSLLMFLIWLIFQVSAFSTWEKELPKIVFDPRFLLLTQKERKQCFEKFVRTRADEERQERKNKLKAKKDEFKALVEEARTAGK